MESVRQLMWFTNMSRGHIADVDMTFDKSIDGRLYLSKVKNIKILNMKFEI